MKLLGLTTTHFSRIEDLKAYQYLRSHSRKSFFCDSGAPERLIFECLSLLPCLHELIQLNILTLLSEMNCKRNGGKGLKDAVLKNKKIVFAARSLHTEIGRN